MIFVDIQKELEQFTLDIKLHIQENEFIVLSGNSGSGKTTLLRVLAGLEDTKGFIEVDGETWNSKTKKLPTQKRSIGFVTQDYALFENMSVERNLLFAQNDKNLAKELLELTELTQMKHLFPSQLSGGQKQRVALCRALMKKPKVLLLDEPLSALDAKIRLKLQEELLVLHKRFHLTTIMVTHDKNELEKVASRVVYIEKGKVVSKKKQQEQRVLQFVKMQNNKLIFESQNEIFYFDLEKENILEQIVLHK